MEPGRSNPECENLRKNQRAEHARDAGQAGDRALQTALRRRIHAPTHQRLERGTRQAPDRQARNARQEPTSSRSHPIDGEAQRAEGQADEQRRTFAEPLHEWPDQRRRDDGGRNADAGERKAHHALAPAVEKLDEVSPEISRPTNNHERDGASVIST